MRASIRAKFEQFHVTGIPVEAGQIEQFFAKVTHTVPVALNEVVAYAMSSDCLGDPRFVYFVARNDGCIKIGVSRNPWDRAKRLSGVLTESGRPSEVCVMAVIRGGQMVEKYLHRAFKDLRLGGEWFSPGPALVALIGEIKNATADAWAQEGSNA